MKLLTVQEVADLARCHHQTVRRAIREKKLKAARRGARIVIQEKDALSWLQGEALS